MGLTEQKLIDQMGFSEREIARRLHLLNFTDSDREEIVKVIPDIEKALPHVIEDHYEYQLSDPEIADVIGDVDTLARLKKYMAGYIQSIFAGIYDEDYVNTRLRIGKVHKRLDVRPKLYMKAHARLQSLLDYEIEACTFVEDAQKIKSAFHKLMLFDAELIFDAYVESYITEMQSATREVEKYAAEVGIKLDSMFNRMHEQNQRDSLTGIYNRRALYDFLKHECRVAVRHKLSFVFVYMDLNGFKAVNDLHGHQAGDEVLKQVAESMLSVTRSVDIPARYGGDEFCILMPRSSVENIDIPLNRLKADFDEKCAFPVTFSMGVVQVGPTYFEEPDVLIDKADLLMYEAKKRAHKDGAHHWQLEDLSKREAIPEKPRIDP